MNNFPSEPLLGKADFILGSNVSIIKTVTKKEIQSSFQLASRTTSLMVYAINRKKIRSCDIIFEPMEIENIGVFEKSGIEKAFNIGYENASRVLDTLLKSD